MKECPDVDLQAAQEENGVTTFYANASLTSRGEVFRTNRADAVVSIVHLAELQGKEIQMVHVDILSAKVESEQQWLWGAIPVYIGVGASINLVDAEAGPFTGTLGVGVDEEFGFRDESVGFKVLGTGLRVGRVCEISVLGSKIGIDWGKLF
jgi:hypothetical protein